MSGTAAPVARRDRGDFVPAGRLDRGSIVPAGRPESGDFNFGLLAALGACAAFWVFAALTVYWVI